jgi:NADH dehydrogenase
LQTQNIIVLGAGYGGIRFAKRISTLLGKTEQYQVILINRHDFHYFKTQLFELAAGTSDQSGVMIPIEEVLKGHDVKFIKGEVDGLDINKRLVNINSGIVLPFKYLVISLGANPNFFNIEGLEENSVTLRSLYTARNARDRIEQVLTSATRPITIAVGGGGLTGVEFAGEFAYRLKQSAYNYNLQQDNYKIIVIEGNDQLLPGMSKKLADYAQKTLEGYGVEVITGQFIKKVTAQTIYLSSQREIDYSLLLWAGGVRGNRLLEEFGLKLNQRGQLLVNEYLQYIDDPCIYAVGDSAYVLNPKTGKPVLPTAQASLQQGQAAADNVYADITEGQIKSYNPDLIMFFITIGKGKGIAQGFDKARFLKLKGRPVSWVKKLIPVRYGYKLRKYK